MKVKLPILAVTLSVFASIAVSQIPSSQSPPVTTDGQELVARAATVLASQPRLEANARQQINLFGQQLSGPGYYAQFGADKLDTTYATTAARLQLKVAIGGEVTKFQQACDGRFLYTQWELPDEKRLTFIDLQRVHQAAQESKSAASLAMTTNWMALGGLPGLLRQLSDNFQFTAPQEGVLGKENVPVWKVAGSWRRDRLAEMIPSQRADILAGKPIQWDELPPQLPHSVVLTLSRDQPFPLFPYRVVYNRHVVATTNSKRNVIAQPVLILELYNVRQRASMQASEFNFKPDDQELIDETEDFILRLGLRKER